MLRRFKRLISTTRIGCKEARGPLLNRLLFVHAHNAGLTGDDSSYLKILNTPGFDPTPSTLNYALTQMLNGCHMMQTSGVLPLSTLETTLARGAYVDPALAPVPPSWVRFFGQGTAQDNPDFLTPLFHAIELANHGRQEYLLRLLEEPISKDTLEHYMPLVKDPRIISRFLMMLAQ